MDLALGHRIDFSIPFVSHSSSVKSSANEVISTNDIEKVDNFLRILTVSK